jgi:histidinol-phosphatase (PHP family)
MQKTIPNLHTHTNYCDGKGNAEEYVISAIEKGSSSIGFSGHAPVPFKSGWNMTNENFEKYLQDIDNLKYKYQNKISVYKGIEADYLKNTVEPDIFFDKNLDFIIGSIHYLKVPEQVLPWDFIISPIVFSKGLEKFYNNDIKKLISDYFEATAEMSFNKSVDIIGHFNQINKFNFGNIYFNENDKFYLAKAEECLKVISENNKIIEINTRGKFRKLSDTFYPSEEILKICKKLNIEITLSADAHSPKETDSYLTEAAKYAISAGYTDFLSLKEGKFEKFLLKEYI